jgi:hypothetical protein
MPMPIGNWQIAEAFHENYLLRQELAVYDLAELTLQVEDRQTFFNHEQRAVYDAVLKSVQNNEGRIFFLQSAGGCGKTYVCNTIAAAVRATNNPALCVASSAIAALLLDGGRTAHSRFKIPIPIFETSFCGIGRNAHLKELIKLTKLIVWDEAPMQHRHAIEALDRSLQDILGQDRPFGGITVLFGGDFRQILPVIPRGSREAIVDASIRKSRLWSQMRVFNLKQNMRLEQSPESVAFAEWLLEVGEGRGLSPEKTITLPQAMVAPHNTLDCLIDLIYPNIAVQPKPDSFFLDRTILTVLNDSVDEINTQLLNRFPGEEITCLGFDTVAEVGNAHEYPIEYLNSIAVPGLPLCHLKLKKGCPLMLLRNMDQNNGLCNGTRMVLLDVKSRVLQCRILGGKHAGNVVFIPRISLQPSNEDLPVSLTRRQFPVRLAFSMTINKSQGQSLHHVGVDLRKPVFSHGQLYVALSRCTSSNRIKVLLSEGSNSTKVTNVVYSEALVGSVFHKFHFFNLLLIC